MWDSGWRARSSGEPAGYQVAAGVAAFRAQVDRTIRGLDDLEIVFDDDDGVAVLHQAVEDLEELLDVRQVQAGGGLIQDVEGAAGGPFAQFPGELEALGLAAGEGGGRLAQLDVAQAHVGQGLQFIPQGRHCPESSRAWSTVRSRTSAMVLPL